MNNKVTVIDVRSSMEFASGKVEGSINIPLDQIVQRMEEIKAIKGSIVLCCAAGIRSFSAWQFLQENGMTNVRNGGAWYDVAEALDKNK
ncbi:rhodanese-like domain-containing protein [Saccharicrinis fermentans]|uniref:Thiosulfate sulfurtransferase PspE n=1 Tax=Saccharicrinis fermentans DSM 9555 = JCM 21142 TaxID=869213 RepID=W7XXN2_9BACT|nr:rhodanese-like domain-containing protein [Saccharicrinis fermentans]GAF03210.1 thiosulfate sulfurtransferase PspE precursor [Saccharicrinis fermentans DSM 9555 = JCM 21142]